MVVVSAGHVGGTHIVSSTADVLWMSVVHGMTRVKVEYVTCRWLGAAWVVSG